MASEMDCDSHPLLLSAEDAFTLLQIKHILPRRPHVNIQGIVTSVSPLMRINKDCVFLVELNGSLIIVIKQSQFHKWHLLLTIGKCFILTHLCPTSLSKSLCLEQKVYVPWKKSQLLLCKDDQSPEQLMPFTSVNLQTWLKENGVCDATYLFKEKSMSACTAITSSPPCLTRYQGSVTDTSQSDRGIFELDYSVKLFLCYLPKLKNPVHIYQHDRITVENAHLLVNKQTGETELFCCVKTSITILPAVKDTSCPLSEVDSSDWWLLSLSLLKQFVVLHSCLQPLFALCEVVSAALLEEPAASSRKKTGKAALQMLLQYLLEELRQRNFLMEFCQHSLFCPLMQEQNTRIPHLILPSQLLKDTSVVQESQKTPLTDYVCTDDLQEWTWEAQNFGDKNDKWLIGWLKVEPATGRLQLSCGQACLDIVATLSSSPRLPDHQCTPVCECTNEPLAHDKNTACHLFHPCCCMRLILVKKCTVVAEKFCCISSGGEQPSLKNYQKHVYLLLSPLHCVLTWRITCIQRQMLLNQKPEPSTATCRVKSGMKVKKNCEVKGERLQVGGRSGNSSKDSALEMMKEKLECSRTKDSGESGPALSQCLVYITNKQHLQIHSRSQNCTSQFRADGYVVITKTDKEAANRQMCSIRNKANAAFPPNEQLGQNEDPVQQRGTQNPQWNNVCNLELKQPVSVTFEGAGCGVYELIHPPGLYRFHTADGTSPMTWPLLDSKLLGAMGTMGTKIDIKVSQLAKVCRIFGCEPALGVDNSTRNAGRQSLKSSLAKSGNHLRTFRAVVISRHHNSVTAGHRETGTVGIVHHTGPDPAAGDCTVLLGQRTLCVTVRDLEDPSVTAVVNVSMPQLVYPLGFLPGAVVDFERLSKTECRNGNKVFQFLLVSRLQLVCFLDDLDQTRVPGTSLEVAQAKAIFNRTPGTVWPTTRLLIDLWREVNLVDPFASQCHLCQFFRISLKSLCVRCGSLFQASGCASPACGNEEDSFLFAKMSILVDDGSSQVLVDVNKRSPPDTARKLLLMTTQQWRLVEKAVQEQGELFLQQFGQRGLTAIETLISLACDSHLIKRPCWMLLSKPVTYNRKARCSTVISAYNALSSGDLVIRKINTGEIMVETQSLPYIHMDCMDVKEI